MGNDWTKALKEALNFLDAGQIAEVKRCRDIDNLTHLSSAVWDFKRVLELQLGENVNLDTVKRLLWVFVFVDPAIDNPYMTVGKAMQEAGITEKKLKGFKKRSYPYDLDRFRNIVRRLGRETSLSFRDLMWKLILWNTRDVKDEIAEDYFRSEYIQNKKGELK